MLRRTWLTAAVAVVAAFAYAGSAYATGDEFYVYCPDQGCVYGPGSSTRGPGHSTYFVNFGSAHNSGHRLAIREFDYGSNRRLYQAEAHGKLRVDHPKYRSYPSCINPPENPSNTRFYACHAHYAEGSSGRLVAEPIPCAGEEWTYVDIGLGEVTVTAQDISRDEVDRLTVVQAPQPSLGVPKPPSVDPDATYDSSTHPASSCWLSGGNGGWSRSGEQWSSGRLADGVGCLTVKRLDGVQLTSCGGLPNGQTVMTYARGESKRADVYALPAIGANSIRIGGRKYAAANGIVVAKGIRTTTLAGSSR